MAEHAYTTPRRRRRASAAALKISIPVLQGLAEAALLCIAIAGTLAPGHAAAPVLQAERQALGRSS
jgi:hypothetical protein